MSSIEDKITQLILRQSLGFRNYSELKNEQFRKIHFIQRGMVIQSSCQDLVTPISKHLNIKIEDLSQINLDISPLKDSNLLICAYLNFIFIVDLQKTCQIIGTLEINEPIISMANGYAPTTCASLADVI